MRNIIKIVLANPRGFCAGVRRAINIVEQAIKKYGIPVYVLHQLVHNDYVVTQLSNKGVVFVEDINSVPDGAVLIFSAHGVSKRIKRQANFRKLLILDATCPLVTKVHTEVARASRNDMEVILIGHKNHPEVEGTMGQYVNAADRQMYLIESVEDARILHVNYPNRLFFVTQTTLSIDDTVEIIKVLRQRFPNIVGARKDDICYATFNRQNALKNLALMVEMIFVVGSDSSSNSKRLAELGERINKRVYFINNANDISKNWLCGVNSIGITAGASVPEILVDNVIVKLQQLNSGKLIVEEMFGIKENIFFDLPKNLK